MNYASLIFGLVGVIVGASIAWGSMISKLSRALEDIASHGARIAALEKASTEISTEIRVRSETGKHEAIKG